MTELKSGADLIMPRESLDSQSSATIQSLPSVVDHHQADHYARAHGLTIDSHRPIWPSQFENDRLIALTISNLPPGQLIENSQLQELLFRSIIPTPEHWQVPAKSLHLLQQVVTRASEADIQTLTSQACSSETAEWRNLKLEAPALRSDHGTDCRRLDRRLKGFLKPSLPDHRLPLDPADINKGEALEFPPTAKATDADMMRAIETEKLEVNKATLAYLLRGLDASWTEEEHREFVGQSSTYSGVGSREPLTPPLSPLKETLPEYFVPDEEACNIPDPSNGSSRLSEDIHNADRRILEADDIFWAQALERNASPERYEDIDVPEIIRNGEFQPRHLASTPQPVSRDLKLDVPLITCEDTDNSAEKPTRVLAPEELAKAKLLVASSDAPSSSDGGGQLVSFFREKAITVMRSVEQEKLQPLDATARVPVPIMDFSLPRLEWEECLWDAKAMFLWIWGNTAVDWQGPKWTHNRAAEQRMVWVPLAHMKEKKLVSESIEVDQGVMDSFSTVCRDCDVLTSADYVHKPPGLAVLRAADDEDDEDDYIAPLESFEQPTCSSQHASMQRSIPAHSVAGIDASGNDKSLISAKIVSPPASLATLLSGKKRLIEETLQKRHSPGRQNREFDIPHGMTAIDIIDEALIPSTNVLRGFVSEYTDFAPLVDNFVEMNFAKKPKLTHSSFFEQSSKATSAAAKTESKANDEAAKLMPPPPKPIPALAPDFKPPNPPLRIVVSSDTSKLITNQLEKLLPGIELISRDYDKRRPPGWSPGIGPPYMDEADVVVSPATGILLTTMVRLRQKPLPGQTAPETATNLRQVAQNVATRYERLVVLVSEGNKHSETASPLSQSDAQALAEFQGFAAGLGVAEMQVVYVGGGVETLAKWLAAIVCTYSWEAGELGHLLLEVETYWEVFLWRAGMNVFAAQIVLGMLKVPDGRKAIGDGEGGGQVSGLPLFVMMSRERRAALFEEVLQGGRVLSRVSEVLDQAWSQKTIDAQYLHLGVDSGFQDLRDTWA